MRIAVVGGGIAGLAAAYRLKTVEPAFRVVLLEESPRLGGKIVTSRAGGWLMEGGPDSFVTYKPAAAELCRELGLGGELVPAAPGRPTYVLSGGRLVRIPEGAASLAPTRLLPFALTPLLSPAGKLRALGDLVLPRREGGEDESLGGFFTRRLGREFYERLAEPLLRGIYAGDPRELSLLATFPRFAELERGRRSLILGLRGGPRASGSVFLTLRGGLESLVGRLREALAGAELKVGARVEGLARGPEGWRLRLAGGESLEADAVVLAVPAFAAAELLRDLAPPAAEELDGIPYGPAATVTFGFDRLDRPLDGNGYVVPSSEGRLLLACTWSSAKYPHRAPPGKALLRAYLGGEGGWTGLDDAALAEAALAELRSDMAFSAAPAETRVHRWSRAMPQYRVGHPDRIRRLEEGLAPLRRLVLAGAAYRGVGVADCVASGSRAAEAVLSALRGGKPAAVA